MYSNLRALESSVVALLRRIPAVRAKKAGGGIEPGRRWSLGAAFSQERVRPSGGSSDPGVGPWRGDFAVVSQVFFLLIIFLTQHVYVIKLL